jgi:hypothetical protein
MLKVDAECSSDMPINICRVQGITCQNTELFMATSVRIFVISSKPRNRPQRRIGLRDVKDPTLYGQSALRTGLALLPRNTIVFVSGNNLCLVLSESQDLVRPEGFHNLKKHHVIGSQIRDLRACSIVP